MATAEAQPMPNPNAQYNEPIQSMAAPIDRLVEGGSYLQKMRNDEGGRGLSDWRGSFGDDELSSTQGRKGD